MITEDRFGWSIRFLPAGYWRAKKPCGLRVVTVTAATYPAILHKLAPAHQEKAA